MNNCGFFEEIYDMMLSVQMGMSVDYWHYIYLLNQDCDVNICSQPEYDCDNDGITINN